MASLEREIYKTVQRIEKSQQEKDKKKAKITPSIARALGIRIDQKIKQMGRRAISEPDVHGKLELISKMLMGISSGNLMNLAVSQSGGLLGKAALAKGLVTEAEQLRVFSLYDQKKLFSFGQVEFINCLYEKLFDGSFYTKSYQEEALELLQTVGKMVDGRKVNAERMTLRNKVYALVQRPMTSIGSGYLIVMVTDDGSVDHAQATEITINPVEESTVENQREVEAKIVRNINASSSMSVGTVINISSADCLAVSEDNKRYYLTYIPDNKPKPQSEPDDVEDALDDVTGDMGDVKKSLKNLEKKVAKESIQEKYLSNDEIQDLIDSIKSKLKNRTDSDAKGMYKLTKDMEKTLKAKGKLHPNSVIAIQRIATGVAGKWGVNSKDWTGKPPSGRLNKYPPPPSKYANA